LELAIFVTGAIVGYASVKRWWRFYAAVAVGLIVNAVAFAIVVHSYPTGEGWDSRSEAFGHWVPNATLAVVTFAILPWIMGLAAGAFARTVRSEERTRAKAHT
jgi:hypothetical protein